VALLAVDDLANLDTGQFANLIDACKRASVEPVVVAGNAVAGASARGHALRWRGLAAAAVRSRQEVPARAVGAWRRRPGARRQPAHARDRARSQSAHRRDFDSRALPAAAETVGALAQSVRADGGADQVLLTPMAPVLVLPRVFEADFCTQLIRRGARATTRTAESPAVNGNVNVSHSSGRGLYGRRADDRESHLRRLAYRIGPELTKVFAFDRQFTFDAHVVLSYSADGKHFFRRHRDNGAPTTSIAPSPCRSTSTTISQAASWSFPNMPASG